MIGLSNTSSQAFSTGPSTLVTSHLGLPGPVLVLAPKVTHPGKPLCVRQIETLGDPTWHTVRACCCCCCCCCVASVVSDSVRPHRRQPTRLPRPWDSPGKCAGVGCHVLLQCVKVKSESEVAQSCSTLKRPHGLQPTRLLHPWDCPGKSTGVGCHCLLCSKGLTLLIIHYQTYMKQLVSKASYLGLYRTR